MQLVSFEPNLTFAFLTHALAIELSKGATSGRVRETMGQPDTSCDILCWVESQTLRDDEA